MSSMDVSAYPRVANKCRACCKIASFLTLYMIGSRVFTGFNLPRGRLIVKQGLYQSLLGHGTLALIVLGSEGVSILRRILNEARQTAVLAQRPVPDRHTPHRFFLSHLLHHDVRDPPARNCSICSDVFRYRYQHNRRLSSTFHPSELQGS